MKIINSYRGGVILPSPNTFIGGVGASTITSAADYVAIVTNLIESDIENFQIDAFNNISFFVSENYQTKFGGSFFGNSEMTYFIDADGKVTGLSNSAFRGCVNLELIELPLATSCTDDNFISSNLLDVVFLPAMIPTIGATSGDEGNFSTSTYQNVYLHVDIETNNGGSPDGDIANATNIQNVVYIANTTVPNDITDLVVDRVFGTALGISWSAPSSTNTLDYYQVFVNDVYKGMTTDTSYLITGLALNTSYSIVVKAVDVYYNRSLSNIVNQTTDASEGIPIGSIISYYPLNSNSNDSVGTNDGTDTSMSYDAGGIVGNRANFTAGTSSKISVADDDSLTFGNGTTDSAFSISCWVKYNSLTNAMFMAKHDGSDWEYDIIKQGSDIFWRLFNNGAVSSYILITHSWSPSTGVWYHIVGTSNGNGTFGGMTLYIDGVNVGSGSEVGSYTAMNGTTVPLIIGKHSPNTNSSLNGYMDELAIFDIELSAAQVLEIKAKNDAGNGLTD